MSERNWLIKLRVAEDAPSSLAFKFPEAALSGAKMIYKRYADADLVEVKPELALAGVTLRPKPWWHWLAGGIVLITALGGTAWWLRRHKPAAAQERPLYILPEPTTPFTVINLLRRMHSDASLQWTDANRAELAQSIQSLENHFPRASEMVIPNLISLALAAAGLNWLGMGSDSHWKATIGASCPATAGCEGDFRR